MMARVFERLSEWVNADAALVRRGRYLSTTFLIEVGEVAWLVTVHEGRVSRVERGPFLMRDWALRRARLGRRLAALLAADARARATTTSSR